MSFEKVVIGNATLYRGDALEVLASIDGIDTVITDPPYSSGGFNEAGKSAGSIGTTNKKAKILGDTMSSEGYIALVRRVLRAANASAAYVFTDWRMWGHTKEAVELSGYRLRGMLVWDKTCAGMGARWKMQHELVAWGTKLTSQMGAGLGNVISIPRSGNEWHPTEKPLALMQAIVRNSEPGTVLDPFMGSGTTGVACASVHRPFIGIELDGAFFEAACRRIEQAQAQAQLFEPSAPIAEQASLLESAA
jgi:DNA modification methylase